MRAGNQSGCRAGASADRASGSARRDSRRPTAAVLRPLRLLGRELSWRSMAMSVRELAAQFLALAEKQRATVPLMIGHRLMGISLMCYGGHRGRPDALRSGDRALRSCRASSAGDAIWPRRCGGSLGLSVVGSVVARLSRGRAQRRGRRAQECARDRSSRHADVRSKPYLDTAYPLRQLRRSNRARPRACRFGAKKKAPCYGRRQE